MTRYIANARMYAVTPAVEAAWRTLIGHILADAGLEGAGAFGFDYLPYPAPQPLEDLWTRSDLGLVQMCGYPIALGMAEVQPIAAPIPSAAWAEGRAVYRSHLIVRADSPYRTLEDTFGGRLGWTVGHSHSGFNALRHHLLRYRTPDRPTLYRAVAGNLITARRVLDSVVDGSIDVGPLDGYWHDLIAAHWPDLTDQIRVIEATDTAPIPAFVAGPAVPSEAVAALKASFAAAPAAPWFADVAPILRLTGFAVVDRAHFATTLAWDAEARAAGYLEPA